MNVLRTPSGWNLTWGTGSEIWMNHSELGLPSRFVARFKYAKPGTNARAFAKFLTANFSPAEYFAARDAGTSPLTILESKGYVSPNMKAAKAAAANALSAEAFLAKLNEKIANGSLSAASLSRMSAALAATSKTADFYKKGAK